MCVIYYDMYLCEVINHNILNLHNFPYNYINRIILIDKYFVQRKITDVLLNCPLLKLYMY